MVGATRGLYRVFVVCSGLSEQRPLDGLATGLTHTTSGPERFPKPVASRGAHSRRTTAPLLTGTSNRSRIIWLARTYTRRFNSIGGLSPAATITLTS